MRTAVATCALFLLAGQALGAGQWYAGRGGSDGDDCSLAGGVRQVNGTFSDALFQATVGSQTLVLWIVRYNRSAIARPAAGGATRQTAGARTNVTATVWAYEVGLADDSDDYGGESSPAAYYRGLCGAASVDRDAAVAARIAFTSYDLAACTVNYSQPWERVECVQLLLYPYGDGARLRFGLSVCDANVSSLAYSVTVRNAHYVSACPSESSLAMVIGATLLAVGVVLLIVGLCFVYRRQRAARSPAARTAAQSDAEERVELNAGRVTTAP